MKIAIPFRLSEEIEALLIDNNVLYRSDLAAKGPHAMRAMMLDCQPDVLIERSPCPSDALACWRAAVPPERSLAIIRVQDAKTEASPTGLPDGIEIHEVTAAKSSHAEIDALLAAEAINVRRLGDHVEVGRVSASGDLTGAHVVMVGGGIVNLVTAYHLAQQGCRIELYDAAQDPSSRYEWQKQGCTFGGGDARIFSLNEGRHHHHKGLTVTNTTNDQFERPISRGGWLSRPWEELNDVDRRWINEFELVPQWLSGRFDSDIISFNQESLDLWRRMMAESPSLFSAVGFRDGLVRLYATDSKFERAKAKEAAIGALKHEIDLGTLLGRHPELRDAVDSGNLAGALEVAGFSVNIHKFGRALIRHLKEKGVTFHWDTPAGRMEQDECGRVTGVRTRAGLVTADHFVVSAGAFGRDLLAGFKAHEKIAPVIGMWLTLPDQDPKLSCPLKVSRSGYASDGAAEGANVIPGTDAAGRDVIHVSSGHGYMGADLKALDHAALIDLARAVHETARDFFPRRYALARQMGMLDEPPRYCIRPWTPSGLGVFETLSGARDGLTVLTGGHNTGGFAQSPSVARAVTAALRGERHPMHSLYHPRRFSDFAGVSYRPGTR